MSDIQDTELMIRAGEADDESAFAILVERYQNILLNHFLRKGVSYSDGEDLVQRTFLRLWRYRSRYSPQAKFTTFLFLLANQESIDFFRAAQSRRALEDGFAAEMEVAQDERAPDPGFAEDEGARVRRAVAGLPEGLRDVVELGVFQDLPYAEVAEILGIPKGTVKSRMFHALRRLKEMFADEQGR